MTNLTIPTIIEFKFNELNQVYNEYRKMPESSHVYSKFKTIFVRPAWVEYPPYISSLLFNSLCGQTNLTTTGYSL